MNIGKTIITVALASAMAFSPVAEKSEVKMEVESIHSRSGIVYAIDNKNDLVYIVDCVDHVWAFYGVEDWLIGDIVSFTLWDSNNTSDSIWDDEIISIGYSGYTLEEKQLNNALDWIGKNS